MRFALSVAQMWIKALLATTFSLALELTKSLLLEWQITKLYWLLMKTNQICWMFHQLPCVNLSVASHVTYTVSEI